MDKLNTVPLESGDGYKKKRLGYFMPDTGDILTPKHSFSQPFKQNGKPNNAHARRVEALIGWASDNDPILFARIKGELAASGFDVSQWDEDDDG